MTQSELREYMKSWRKIHPDYHKNYHATHYKPHRRKVRRIRKGKSLQQLAAEARVERASLPDWYIRSTLVQEGFEKDEITPELIKERRQKTINYNASLAHRRDRLKCAICLFGIGLRVQTISKRLGVGIEMVKKCTSNITPPVRLSLKDRRRLSNAKRHKMIIKTLDDEYVIQTLRRRRRWLKPKDFPPELVELQRQKLMLQRELKNGNHTPNH